MATKRFTVNSKENKMAEEKKKKSTKVDKALVQQSQRT